MNKFLMMMVVAMGLQGTGAMADASVAPLTAVTLSDGRVILGDETQMTAYIFDVDNGSESNCYDACAGAWPPILAPANTQLGADLGTTTRKDGTVQLTHKGKPIYLFVGDKKPTDINGDGLQGVWHIIAL